MLTEQPRFRPDAIRELMARYGLKKSAFAARIGVSRQRVSVWLRGDISPQFPIVLLMCGEFGVDPGFFAEGLDEVNCRPGTDARLVELGRGTETARARRTG